MMSEVSTPSEAIVTRPLQPGESGAVFDPGPSQSISRAGMLEKFLKQIPLIKSRDDRRSRRSDELVDSVETIPLGTSESTAGAAYGSINDSEGETQVSDNVSQDPSGFQKVVALFSCCFGYSQVSQRCVHRFCFEGMVHSVKIKCGNYILKCVYIRKIFQLSTWKKSEFYSEEKWIQTTSIPTCIKISIHNRS